MSVIAKAIADRQSEIKALNDVDKILGTSAPPAKPAARRSSSRRTRPKSTTRPRRDSKPKPPTLFLSQTLQAPLAERT